MRTRDGLARWAAAWVALVGLGVPGRTEPAADMSFGTTDEARLRQFHADRCLDALEGRDWLLTDVQSLDALEARAKERGLALTLVPIVQRTGVSDAWRQAVPTLGHEPLGVAAELGPIVFVRMWLRLAPQETVKRLAVMVLPDLWSAEGMAAVPNGLLFLGASDAASVRDGLDARLAKHRELWDEVGEQLATTPSSSPALAELRLRLRRQVAWVANNLGVLLEGAERPADAFEAYTRARAIDPQNASALLNRAVCVKRGVRPELSEQIGQELEGLRENMPDPRMLWSLTQAFGEVVHPEEFLPLGWAWALSGIPASDKARWQKALESVAEEHRDAVRRQLEASQAGQTGMTDGDLRLLDALGSKEGSARGEALIVLARRAAGRGRVDEAERWLAQAEASGVPAVTLTAERVALLTAAGKPDDARNLLEKALADHPSAWQLLVLRGTLQADAKDVAGLEGTVAKLEAVEGVDPYHVQVAKGRLLALQGKNWQARDLLLQAIKGKPAAVFLYDLVLPLDFALDDKRSAEQHADALLQAIPSHAFANYVKGSLLLERKEYPVAETFFRRSLEAAETLYALNDFAVLLIETKRPQDAERIARRTLELDPAVAAAWDTLASALEAQGRGDEAFAALEKAVACEGSDDPRIQFHWAKALHQRGDAARAQAAADKAHAGRLKLDPRTREELLVLRDALKRAK